MESSRIIFAWPLVNLSISYSGPIIIIINGSINGSSGSFFFSSIFSFLESVFLISKRLVICHQRFCFGCFFLLLKRHHHSFWTFIWFNSVPPFTKHTRSEMEKITFGHLVWYIYLSMCDQWCYFKRKNFWKI